MLAEAIDRISGLARDAAGVEITELGHRKILVASGGSYSEMQRPPKPRNHAATNGASFVSLVNELKAESAIVFVSEGQVVAILDSNDREDRVTLELPHSEAYKAFALLGVPQNQRSVIRMLREELYGAIDLSFLAIIRRLDFTRRNDGNSSVMHGRESLGRSVEATVQSAEGEVPEIVAVQLRVHEVPDLVGDITFRAAVSVDPTEEKIALRSAGDSFRRAVLENQAKIVSQLEDDFASEPGVTVVAGKP